VAVEQLKQRLFHVLEVEESDVGLERAVNIGLLALIVVNVVAVILETVQSLKARYDAIFDVIEAVSIGVFTVEYLLRVWSCTVNPEFRKPLSGRLRFVLSPLALIDLAAIVPAYLPGDVFLDLRYARIVRLIRMLRLLKISRYSKTVRLFANVVRSKKADLGLIALLLVLLLVIASSSMYFIEHSTQPETFSSIPAAMWWAIQTLTTVGYGDILPQTPPGKLVGSLIALIGIGFFALPAGVLSAAFAEELAKMRVPRTCRHCGQLIDE
jgi:voltage-gated potassium channel